MSLRKLSLGVFLFSLVTEGTLATDGTFSLPISKKAPHQYSTLSKRADGTLQVTLINPPSHNLYAVNISLGTPPQQQTLQIDTGSSDLWVQTPNSQLCQAASNPCTNSGTFNSNKSSTFKIVVQNGFESLYGDGSGANGSYATDTLEIGGISVPDFEFGLAEESTSAEAVFGIAFSYAEFAQTPYPNIVDRLVTQKVINSHTYSLFLDSPDASTGSLLFGGLDTSKYTGTLHTLPILHAQGRKPTRFFVALTSLALVTERQTMDFSSVVDFPLAVVLDSGSTQTIVSDALMAQIVQITNAVYLSQSDIYIIDCAVRTLNASFMYQFGGSSGPKIVVPITNVALPLTGRDGSQVTADDGTPICLLGFSGNGDSQQPGALTVFGDTFLRNAYVVFDLGNDEISIAQAAVNSTASSNILPIPAGGVASVVSASGGASESASVPASATIRNSVLTGAPTGATITGSGASAPTSLGLTATSSKASTTQTTASIASPTHNAANRMCINRLPSLVLAIIGMMIHF